MSFRYLAGRGLVAFCSFAAIAAPLMVFLFPTTRDDAPTSCFGGKEFISFRPLWHREGLPMDVFGFYLEAGIAVALAVGVWFMYPAFRPLPPSTQEGRVR